MNAFGNSLGYYQKEIRRHGMNEALKMGDKANKIRAESE